MGRQIRKLASENALVVGVVVAVLSLGFMALTSPQRQARAASPTTACATMAR